MKSATGRVHSIETFGVLDGPGTRLVVFVQGCPLRCAYCHNPDTWALTGGKEVSPEEILRIFDKNRPFYRTGGITVSGGEPLLQAAFVADLFEAAHSDAKGPIHTCLDTSGYLLEDMDEKTLQRLLGATDLVLLDIKNAFPKEYKDLTGKPLSRTLTFLAELRKHQVKTLVRQVVVPGLTDDTQELSALGALIARYPNIVGFELLPYHTMGVKKYRELGIPYRLEGVAPQNKEEMEVLRGVVLAAYEKARAEQEKIR